MFEQASAPSLRPSQQDNKAYRLNLTSRALNVLKLAQVNIDPIIAKQGKLLGEIISAHCLEQVTCSYVLSKFWPTRTGLCIQPAVFGWSTSMSLRLCCCVLFDTFYCISVFPLCHCSCVVDHETYLLLASLVVQLMPMLQKQTCTRLMVPQ